MIRRPEGFKDHKLAQRLMAQERNLARKQCQAIASKELIGSRDTDMGGMGILNEVGGIVG